MSKGSKRKKGMRGTTIAINGRLYDARTGLPVTAHKNAPKQTPNAKPAHHNGVISDIGGAKPQHQPAQAQKPHPHTARTTKAAQSIHSKTQRSQTLYRAALQRPEAQHQAEKQPVKRSSAIQKFAPVQAHKPAQPAAKTEAPVAHHVQQAAPSHQPAKTQQTPLQGSALKEKLIADKMAEATPTKEDKKTHSRFNARRFPRLATIASGVGALVLLGGYLTYLNLPNLSLRVAASQAGVAATYPTYQPSGYSFMGPVAYSPGEVRVNFKSNTNNYAYSVVQRQSSWDSQAVRDNYVVKENKQYTTIQEGGITIYLVDNKAVWVNGGVLYSVEGNAPLSGEQVQKIASSTL